MTNDTSESLILVIDHNRRNVALLTQFLEQQGYQVLSAISLEEGIQIIEQPSRIVLALVDISGFDYRVWMLCQELRQRNVPFLVISHQQQAAIQQASIMHGALGLLGKPLITRKLTQLIRDLLKGAE